MKFRPPRGITSLIGSLLIRLLAVTWRIEWRGLERLERAKEISPRLIYSFWHGRLIVLSWTHRNRKIHVLASDHYDGDLMGRTIEWLGFGHLKGSSTRGGAKGLRDMARVIREGYDIGLTVDGPKGPRGIVKQGAVELARLSGAVIVPISDSADRRWLIPSWDRLQVPSPFATVVVEYGEPIIVPRDSDEKQREASREKLEGSLAALTSDLDRKMGHSGVMVWPHEDS